MLLNNERCKALTLDYVNRATGLELHQFKWLQDDDLIGELPHVYHIAGMALVFGGIWLSSTARPQLAAIASEP